MKTNRDLYKAIESLLKEKKDQTGPSLEAYLTNLLNLAERSGVRSGLPLDDFFALLRDAFEPNPSVGGAAPPDHGNEDYQKWCAEIRKQIADLQEMASNGQLDNDQKYFGMSAPSGRYWYNFDPCTYIECGVAGAFGGWEDGDDTGRSYVPGDVADVDSDGELKWCDPRELDRPPVEIPEISWEEFAGFVWYGQNYE